MKCSKCGKEIADDSLFCEFCGAKQKPRFDFKYLIFFFIGIISVVCVILRQCDRESVLSSIEEPSSINSNSVILETSYKALEEGPQIKDSEKKSQENIQKSISSSDTTHELYYVVIVPEAKIYDYCIADDKSTFMQYSHLVYKKGTILNGEIVELPIHGKYIMFTWDGEEGESKRGFISVAEVNLYDAN